MKKKLFYLLMSVVCLLTLAACGSGSKDLNGSITVTQTTEEKDTYVSADITIEYKNPQRSDVLGTKIEVYTTDGVEERSFTYFTNNSGKTVYTYLLPKVNTPYTFYIRAKTGDLDGSTGIVVPALKQEAPASLTAAPNAVSFASNAQVGQAVQIILTGGTTPYACNVNPSPNDYIGASINGNILTVSLKKKNESTSDMEYSIMVTDKSSPTKTLEIKVKLAGKTAPTAITATPTSVTFANGAKSGDKFEVSLSGGDGNYSAAINPIETSPSIEALLSGNKLTVTLKIDNTVTGEDKKYTILISDQSTPAKTLEIPVTLTAKKE